MKPIKQMTTTLSNALNKISTQVTSSSQSSAPARNKDEDLSALRTILSMLSYIQSPDTRPTLVGPLSTDKEESRTLRLLDSLAAVLVRSYEITAVVTTPYDQYDGDERLNLQVIASVIDPSHSASVVDPSHSDSKDAPLPQSGDSPSLWRWLRDFTIVINPRTSKINHHEDSLINKSGIPNIGCHQEKVPEDLVKVKDDASLLEIFLKNYW